GVGEGGGGGRRGFRTACSVRAERGRGRSSPRSKRRFWRVSPHRRRGASPAPPRRPRAGPASDGDCGEAARRTGSGTRGRSDGGDPRAGSRGAGPGRAPRGTYLEFGADLAERGGRSCAVRNGARRSAGHSLAGPALGGDGGSRGERVS